MSRQRARGHAAAGTQSHNNRVVNQKILLETPILRLPTDFWLSKGGRGVRRIYETG
jgi:hypothetical protein